VKTPHRALARALPAACLVAAALTAAPGSASPVAHAAATCSTPIGHPQYPGSKGGYFSQLTVSATSCGRGKQVIVAQAKCRLKHGIKGRCTSTVLGYSCKEKRGAYGPTEFSARVTCSKSSARIRWYYQQNTH
jgi:hypothetical protein